MTTGRRGTFTCRPRQARSGCVHIYTGDGKGKTTAAFGAASRALGAGFRVCIIQFLKGGHQDAAEKGLRRGELTIVRGASCHPVFWPKHFSVKDLSAARKGLKAALKRELDESRRILQSGRYDLVVLDEIMNAVQGGFIPEAWLLEVVRSKSSQVELILTGRGAGARLLKTADYVTECRCIKHPFDRGLLARPGIEY